MAKRKRGATDGSIFQLPDGRWRCQVELGTTITGKRQRRVFEAPTKAECAARLTEALHQKNQGVNLVPVKESVGGFLNAWLSDVVKPGTREKTYTLYEYLIRYHAIPELGELNLAKLKPERVQAMLKKKVEAGLSPKTVKHLRDTLRNAFNCAVKWDLMHKNPAALAKPPGLGPQELHVFTPEEAQRFLAATQGHRWEAVFTAAISLGLRQGEILGLRWDDLRLEGPDPILTVRHSLQRKKGGGLELVQPKTVKSRRTLSLPDVAVEAFKSRRAIQHQERLWAGKKWMETGLVFTTLMGTGVDQRRLLHHFYKLRDAAKLPKIRFHDLRHSAATLLLAQNVHPKIVSELLGHSTISLTMNTYSHVLRSMNREAAKQMDSVLGNRMATVNGYGEATGSVN